MTTIKENKSKSIGVISLPMGPANIRPFHNFVNIMAKITNDLRVVATYQDGLDVGPFCSPKSYEIRFSLKHNVLERIFIFVAIQIRMCWNILNNFQDVEICFMYLGDFLILPLIMARIMNMKTVLIMGGNMNNEFDFNKNPILYVIKLFRFIDLHLFNKILLYSPHLVEEWGLEKYRNKIIINREHFVDVDEFKVDISFCKRKNIVGFIGRFSEEKGISNFVHAIDKIDSEKDIGFLIGGDGYLKRNILDSLSANSKKNVEYVGWIPHNMLPLYLNKLKLLVLPSYSEGLPNIMLESMSCGTPVLVTSVGAIPDIIINNENGFILKNNLPENIAKNIINILRNSDLELISKRSRISIEKDFILIAVVEKWKTTLNII